MREIYFKIQKQKPMICPFLTSFPIDESKFVLRESSMQTNTHVYVIL